MVARDHEQRAAGALQKRGRAFVLLGPATVREIAAGDDQSGSTRSINVPSARSTSRRLHGADMQVGEVEEPRWHRPKQASTLSYVPDESTEIFDDLYLGLRAGGAMRKQRRGEPLTEEEQEALGRWQRLSTWRKAAAVGAFGVGTFGLGFTLGGLVFGRWRKA